MNMPMIPSYHQELSQQQAQSQALSSEQVKKSNPQLYFWISTSFMNFGYFVEI